MIKNNDENKNRPNCGYLEDLADNY